MINDPIVKRRNLFKVAYVAVCFLMLFTAYMVAQNLVTQIYKEFGFTGLGQACVFTIYCSLGISNIFASHIKRNISHRAGLFFGGSGYVLFVIAGAFTTSCNKFELDIFLCEDVPLHVLNIVFSVFVGLGGSILWLTQSDYVNRCSDHTTKGLFNSVFWSISQFAQIIGSILGTFVLGTTDQFVFYMMLLGFAAIALVMFALSPSIEPLRSEIEVEKPKETLSESISKYFAVLKSSRSAFLLVPMSMIGLITAFYASYLSIIIDETISSTVTNEINERVGIVFIALAIGEVIAGLVVGRLADSMDKMKLLHFLILVPEFALIISLLAHFTKVYAISVFAGFLWGFCDTAFNSIVVIMIGAYFGGILELFCIMRSFVGVGVVYGSGIAIGLSTQVLAYTLIIIGSMFVLHLVFFKITPRKIENNEEEKGALNDAKKKNSEKK